MAPNFSDDSRRKIILENLQAKRGVCIAMGDKLARKEFPVVKWAVPNLLPEGYGVLGGRPKIGKSWLALDLALAVALGGYAIGSQDYPATAGTVLYLALEDTERRLQERQRLLVPYQQEGLKRIIYAITWPRLHNGGLEALTQFLDVFTDCRLVIIDTLAKIKPQLKRGSDPYEHDMEIGGQLQAIANKYHICLLAIHHTRKTRSEVGDFVDELAGSTGITGSPDFIAQLVRGRGEHTGILKITGKDIPDLELALKFDDCRWIHLGSARDYRISATQDKVLQCLKNSSEPLKPKEISELTEMSEAYVKKVLRILLDTDLIKKSGKGTYTINI